MRYDSENWKRRPDVFKFKPIFILVICRRKFPWIVSLHSDILLMEFWSLYLGCYQPNSVFSIFNVLLKIAWYCPFNVFLTRFVKNGEIRHLNSYKIVLEQREKRNQLNSWKEQLVICSSAFWKQKWENLKNVSLTSFQFQSIPAYSVSSQRH